jgi:hypothetical protein
MIIFYQTLVQKFCFQSSAKLSEVNVKDTFTSHIDKKIFLIFLLTPYLYTFSLYENPSFIIFSAETEFGAALTTVLPVLFKYCYKYCYSDSRKF